MKAKNPCIGVCKFDPATSLCIACFRTRDERKTWKSVSEERRVAVLDLRAERERELVSAGVAVVPSKKSKKDKQDKKDEKKSKKKKDRKDQKKTKKKKQK